MGRGNSAAGGLEASISSLSLLLCVGWTDRRTSLTLCFFLSTWGCGGGQLRPYSQSCFNACFENNTSSQRDLTIREQLGPAWIPCLHGCDFIPEKSKWKQEKTQDPAGQSRTATHGGHAHPPAVCRLPHFPRAWSHPRRTSPPMPAVACTPLSVTPNRAPSQARSHLQPAAFSPGEVLGSHSVHTFLKDLTESC